MEIRYSREMNHNYMIVEASEKETGYEARMLSANAIKGLLKFRVHRTEEAVEYWYEITSRQPLKRVFAKRTLSGQELRTILLGVLAVLERVEEYLLKEEQLLLDPEYLYLEPDQLTVELCLVPGHREETPKALSDLLGYLLERVDHQDREAVVLAYNLYQTSLKENYGTADLLRQLSGNDRIFSPEESKNEANPKAEDRRLRRPENVCGEETWEGEAEPAEDRRLRSTWNERENGVETASEPATQKMKLADRMENQKEEPGRTGGENGGWRLNCLIRTLGSAAAAGIVYWYVTGELGVWLYGVSGGIGMLVFIRECLAVRKKRKVYRGRANERDGELSRIEKAPQTNGQTERTENRWQVYPESEEVYRQELRREEEAQMERAKEAGTTLLSASSNGKEAVRLEPLEAGGTVIKISYVPFTLGKHPGLSDACIERSTVSRLHARIDKKEGVYILTDLNSTNGTSVNGYQLQANETVSLGNGDSVYLADIGYKFWEN